MEKSQTIGEITKALAKFRGELPEIKLNSTVQVQTKTGRDYSFKYADLPHIKSIADPVLSKNDLFVSQFIEGNGELTTLLSHTSGEYFQSTTTIGSVDGKTAQEYGSLITYFKRYSYCAVLGIAADDDDDANTAEGNAATKTKMAPADAPWLNDAEFNEALTRINNGEKGVFVQLQEKYKIKKDFRKSLEEAEKNPVKMPPTESKEDGTVKPEILPNTDGWAKTVVWLSKFDGFFFDGMDKLRKNYVIAEEHEAQLEKEALILKKGAFDEPTEDEKANKMVKGKKETA